MELFLSTYFISSRKTLSVTENSRGKFDKQHVSLARWYENHISAAVLGSKRLAVKICHFSLNSQGQSDNNRETNFLGIKKKGMSRFVGKSLNQQESDLLTSVYEFRLRPTEKNVFCRFFYSIYFLSIFWASKRFDDRLWSFSFDKHYLAKCRMPSGPCTKHPRYYRKFRVYIYLIEEGASQEFTLREENGVITGKL